MSHFSTASRFLIVVSLLLLLFGTAFVAAQSTHSKSTIDNVVPPLQEEDDESALGLTPEDWSARLPIALVMAVIVISVDAVIIMGIMRARRRGGRTT